LYTTITIFSSSKRAETASVSAQLNADAAFLQKDPYD